VTDWIDYEWISLRVVPRVHREEFVNVGIVLHARQRDFLELRLAPKWSDHVSGLAPELEIARVERHLDTYARITKGDAEAGPVALLPPSERFHWLAHPRSGILQTSARHPGRTHDLDAELARLVSEQCTP